MTVGKQRRRVGRGEALRGAVLPILVSCLGWMPGEAAADPVDAVAYPEALPAPTSGDGTAVSAGPAGAAPLGEGVPGTGAAAAAVVAERATAAASASAIGLEADADGLRLATPGPSMTLAEAFETARARHPALQAVSIELEKADAMLHQAWGNLLPRISAQLMYTLNDQATVVDFSGGISIPGVDLGGPMVLRQQHILQSTVSVQVPLFNMPIYAGIDLARLGRRMAMLGEETAARQLLLGVATAYYGALSARELVDLHADTFRTAQRRLTAARARLAAEAGVRIDVARAELEVETARMNQQAAVFGFDRARQAIAGLLAMDELPMPVAPEDDIAPPSSADAVVERALENRSDLELQAYRIDLAEKNLWMAWTAFFPTLGLAWQLNTEITDPAGLGGRRNMWALVAVLGIPIYDEPRYGLLEQRRAEIRQAELNLEAARLELETEIRSAVREYESSLTTIETASRQVELAAEALRLAEAAFAAGAGTSLDVDSAQAAANAARVNLTVQKYQSRMALVKLLFLAGEVPGGE